MVLVTGAAGQVGSALMNHLRSIGYPALASDREAAAGGIVPCDLTLDQEVTRLFRHHSFSAVIHLAGWLPTAFRANPLAGSEVNLAGTLRLLRASIHAGVQRFVFASSASVYGSSARPLCDEESQPWPDDPYGAAKLAIEQILEQIPPRTMETVSLRIARVVGPGTKITGSPWRSQIFERCDANSSPLIIPFGPESRLSVLHADDLARILLILVEAPVLARRIYNTPVEILRAGEIRRLAELVNGWQVTMGDSSGGPEIDGMRFCADFGFALRPLEEHMLNSSPRL